MVIDHESKRETWNPSNLHETVEKTINKEMKTQQAADRNGKSRTTLNDRIDKIIS